MMRLGKIQKMILDVLPDAGEGDHRWFEVEGDSVEVIAGIIFDVKMSSGKWQDREFSKKMNRVIQALYRLEKNDLVERYQKNRGDKTGWSLVMICENNGENCTKDKCPTFRGKWKTCDSKMSKYLKGMLV